MRDTRTKLQIRIDALQRLAMWCFLSARVPYYLVTEYPKSGGSWCGQMLSSYLGIPFPRNQRPRLLPPRPTLLHGHRRYSPSFANVFCVFRDGRDVMVSAYYHRLHHNDRNVPWWVEKNRAELPLDDYDDVEGNMPAFIDFMFTRARQGVFHFSWDEFILSWIDKGAPIIKYEELLADAAGTLARALKQVTGEDANLNRLREIDEQFSFKNQAGRQPGQGNAGSFLRKGIAGDWKNVFSLEARKQFDKHAGEALIAAGYEKDHGWATALVESPSSAKMAPDPKTETQAELTGGGNAHSG